jgi:hypothetical protein
MKKDLDVGDLSIFLNLVSSRESLKVDDKDVFFNSNLKYHVRGTYEETGREWSTAAGMWFRSKEDFLLKMGVMHGGGGGAGMASLLES